MGGGTLYPQDELDRICDRAHARGLKVHMDGARLFNAATATGLAPARIVAKLDTVMMCLSKALGAPVGSLIAGTNDAMAEARRYRKHLGGGMRQAGVLAAAGLVALEESPAKLAEDHANAKFLADGLGVQAETNIVIFDIAKTGLTAGEFVSRMKDRGVLVSAIGGTRVRLVTHYDVSRADCERAAAAIRAVIS
jgi:threonine aldolase